jgi:hypothetical protein
MFATRFGLPVRTHVLKTAFRAAAKNITFGESPHIDSASLGKRDHVVGALAAERGVANALFSNTKTPSATLLPTNSSRQ